MYLFLDYPGAKPLRPFSSDTVAAAFQHPTNKSMPVKSLGPSKNISIASLKSKLIGIVT